MKCCQHVLVLEFDHQQQIRLVVNVAVEVGTIQEVHAVDQLTVNGFPFDSEAQDIEDILLEVRLIVEEFSEVDLSIFILFKSSVWRNRF